MELRSMGPATPIVGAPWVDAYPTAASSCRARAEPSCRNGIGRMDPPKVVSLGKMGRCEMRGPPKILDRPDGALGRPARSSQRRVAGRSPVRGGRLQFAGRFWLRAAARDRNLGPGPRGTA